MPRDRIDGCIDRSRRNRIVVNWKPSAYEDTAHEYICLSLRSTRPMPVCMMSDSIFGARSRWPRANALAYAMLPWGRGGGVCWTLEFFCFLYLSTFWLTSTSKFSYCQLRTFGGFRIFDPTRNIRILKFFGIQTSQRCSTLDLSLSMLNWILWIFFLSFEDDEFPFSVYLHTQIARFSVVSSNMQKIDIWKLHQGPTKTLHHLFSVPTSSVFFPT